MTTDDPRFTSLSMDSSSHTHQPTSHTNNSARAQKYSENSGTEISFFQSRVLTIIMIVISLSLLVICIVLAILLAATLKSSTTSSTTGPTTDSTTVSSTPDATTTIPVSTVCGIQEIQPDPASERIYGGTEAVPNSWPWIVFYEEVELCENATCPMHLCGGTLIKSRYVLTAAHCINSEENSSITIYAGLHDKRTVVENENLQYRTVADIFIHPAYNARTITNDIAILRLSSPFELNKYVQIACLPGAEPQVGDTVIIAGWGTDELGGQPSDVLMQAFTQVVGNCTGMWVGGVVVNDARQICVANIATGVSMCSGDSGGPILSKDGNQWVVSGAASFVNVCNTTDNVPNVYTRVAYYLPWINGIIQRALSETV